MTEVAGVFRNGKRVLRKDDGSLVKVNPSAAARLLAEGNAGVAYKDVSEEEVRQFERVKEAETPLGIAKTAGQQFLSSATSIAQGAHSLAAQVLPKELVDVSSPLGMALKAGGESISDRSSNIPMKVASAAGFDPQEYRKQELAGQQANPGVAMGASLVGDVAGAAPFGLAGGLSRAAGARLGTAGALAGGAVEGAVGGAAAAEAQAQLEGNPGATAEQLATMALGGAGIGLLAEGGSRVIANVLRKAKAEAASAAADELIAARGEMGKPIPPPPEQVAAVAQQVDADGSLSRAASWLGEKLGKGQELVAGADKEALENFGVPGLLSNDPKRRASAEAAWKMYENAPAARQKAVTQLTDDVAELGPLSEKASKQWGMGVEKNRIVRDYVPDTLESRAHARGVWDEVRQTTHNKIAEIENRYANALQGRDVASIRTSTDVLKRVLNNGDRLMREAPGAPEKYMAMEQVKRDLFQAARSINLNTLSGNARSAAEDVLAFVDPARGGQGYELLRRRLEEPAWGPMGAIARDYNETYHKLLQGEPDFRRAFTRDGERELGGITRQIVDPQKVESTVARVGKYKTDPTLNMVRQRIDGTQALLEKNKKYFARDPKEIAEIDKGIEAAKRMRATLDEVDNTAAVLNQIENGLVRPENLTTGSLAGLNTTTLALLGGVMFGPGAFAGGLATGATMRPASTALMVSRVKRMLTRASEKKIAGRAASWVLNETEHEASVMAARASRLKSAEAGFSKAVNAVPTAGRTVRRAGGAAAVGGAGALARFQGKSKTFDEAFEKKHKQVAELTSNPSALADAAEPALRELQAVSPELAGATYAKLANAIQYLKANAPPGLGGPSIFSAHQKALWAPEEQRRWARVVMAVVAPETVIEDLERGMATPEQVEALKATHPEEYALLRSSVLTAVADAQEKGNPLPRYVIQQLDILLQLNGAGVPGMSAEIGELVRDAHRVVQQHFRLDRNKMSPSEAGKAGTPAKPKSNRKRGPGAKSMAGLVTTQTDSWPVGGKSNGI